MTAIKKIHQLGAQWPTQDPFLFCAYHLDHYPKGNGQLGPDAPLEGRVLGQDFKIKEGWRMYHGHKVPGFPGHPHRGFETITIVEKGFADHSDSMGAGGRFGNGDVQWMTAGKGLQHSEMFPLLNPEAPNPLLMFQIWLNLPKASKMVEPHYKMLWNEDIPRHKVLDSEEKKIHFKIIAGTIDGIPAVPPAPDSWAVNDGNHVQIWLVELEAFAKWELPTTTAPVNRTLYFYDGTEIETEGYHIPKEHGIDLFAERKITIANGSEPANFLFLQGRPIGEPVVQQGPFVMNTREEISAAINQYRQTEFGGWPWPDYDHTHPAARGRFARYADGTEETRE